MHSQTRSSSSTVTMAYQSVPLPASPTLTNPDMILPYGEYEDSPPASPGSQWRGPDMHFSLGPPHSNLGVMTPTTPIIYGNGTMLSDIGEVTEAESTPGRKLPGPAERRMLKQQAAQSNGHSPLQSSPTMGYHAVMKRTRTGTHQRKVSIESTSTVKSEGQTAKIFEDFDDGISVDDSALGDDEESVADSYSEGVIASEIQRLSRKDDRFDNDEVSRRAEEVLMNAKRRLDTFGGNLTRANSFRPSGSLSSIHSSSPLSRSTPSPSENESRIQTQLGGLPSKHRQITTPSESPIGSPGHSRVYSEMSIPSRSSPFPARSASAAARYIGRSDGSPRSPNFTRTPDNRSGVSSNRPSPPNAIVLEPLSEDDVVPDFKTDRSSVISGLDDLSVDHRTLTRSTSAMHIRDLEPRMQDLKGRLSVLRDRNRDDQMKRRSLQSLRTPSPFTAAEQWYSGAKNGEPSDLLEPPSPTPIVDTVQTQHEYAPSDATSVYEDVESHHGTDLIMAAEEPKAEEEEEEEEEEGYDTALEDDSKLEEADESSENDYSEEIVNRDEADEYESDASLYHDTMVSHEDREDAFDYEHFFLHSAMGTISQQRRRGSFSSEGSAETARGPSAPATNYREELKESERVSLGHIRSESTDTVSTMASFATATEGLGSKIGDGDEDADALPRQDFAVQYVQARAISTSQPNSAKRSTFGSVENSISDPETVNGRRGSVIYDKDYQSGHSNSRPSVNSMASFESFESTGTTRSFPLVNKPKAKPTSASSSAPDLGRKGSETSILGESATLAEGGADSVHQQSSQVHMLAREDQIQVERLVESLGKCVLGLQEAGRASPEGRMWRRRLDHARRVLEGWEGAV